MIGGLGPRTNPPISNENKRRLRSVFVAEYVFPLPGWNGSIELHHGTHKGASDLMANRGWPVVSITSGVVESAGNSPIGGNNVTIRGDDNLEYYYAHLDQTPLVRSGNRVNAATRIGAVGNTGNAETTPPHLHIGIGPEIGVGVGPSGGAGVNFDAVDFLRKIYAGQPPNVGDTTDTETSSDSTGNPIVDAIGEILSAIFGAFSSFLGGK